MPTFKLSRYADAERTDYHEDILPKSQSVIDMVRVATYIHQVPTALEMVKDAHDLLPVLRCVQDTVEPMRAKLLWGFDLPYMLTGFLNQHPRSAIKFKESKTKGHIADFYNEIWE